MAIQKFFNIFTNRGYGINFLFQKHFLIHFPSSKEKETKGFTRKLLKSAAISPFCLER